MQRLVTLIRNDVGESSEEASFLTGYDLTMTFTKYREKAFGIRQQWDKAECRVDVVRKEVIWLSVS